jgi:monofunctional biosynthetic peptidoglycan transglycosylase
MLTVDRLPGLRGSAAKIVRWTKPHWLFLTSILVGLFLALQILILPFGKINALRNRNPTTTALMEERLEAARNEGKHSRKQQEWIPLKEIPRDVVSAVIVSEDGTFWSHHGFDWYELKESIEADVEKGRAARGASTISQQLVKNLYLSSSKNPLRKMKEWILTWWMEKELSKSRILELYLNVIEWGDGVYGVGAAAIFHFGKPLKTLTREEAARLAAVIPSPRRHMANSESEYVVSRSKLILERMEARGL